MKKPGTVCDYLAERNAALCKLFGDLIAKKHIVNIFEIFKEMASNPAPKFYVSEEKALVQIRHYRRQGFWNCASPTRKSLFEALYAKVVKLQLREPQLSLKDAISRAIDSPAPSFFLTHLSIKTLVYDAYKVKRNRNRV